MKKLPATSLALRIGITAALTLGSAAAAQRFAEPVLLTGSPPRAIAVLDLDGNPRLDLVTADHEADTISLLRAMPQGGYEPALTWPAGNGPNALAVADMNLDGLDDVLVVDELSSQLAVLLLSDAGETTTTWTYAFSGQPFAVAAGDLDGDGDADVVVAETQLNRIAVRLGLGAAGLGPVTSYPAGQRPHRLCLIDLDGDGDRDVVTANSLSQDVSVLLNNGAGGFGHAPTTLPVGGEPTGLTAADFDGDTQPDVAVAVYGPAVVQLLLGDGAGSLAAGPALALSHSPRGLLEADLDDDGRPDLVVPTEALGGLAVLMNSGAGAFQPVLEHMPGTQHDFGALADLDADGRVDLALDEPKGVVLLSGDGQGGFREPAVVPFGTTQAYAISADVNGDGRDDLIGAQTGSFLVEVRLADGLGGFAAPITSPVVGFGRLAAADLDEDGAIDLVSSDFGVAVSLGDGAGGFLRQAVYPLLENYTAADSADMNGDGHPDLVVLTEIKLFNTEWHSLGILLGDGTGSLGPEQSAIQYGIYGTFPTAPAADRMVLGDINGDGKTDVAVGDATDTMIRFFLGDGAGGVTSAGNLPLAGYTGTKEQPLVLADLDEDSDLDLVACTSTGLKACLGNGNGSFGSATTLTTLTGSRTVLSTDIDADGHLDLVVNGPTGTHFVVLLGDGTGAFETEFFGTGGSSNRPLLSQLDGDDLPDLVCLGSTGTVYTSAIVSPNLALSAQWADLGFGLAGTNGVPSLVGTGTLQAGSPGSLKLTNANPNKLAVLFISKASTPAPFKGGVLATVPPLISFLLFTNGAGSIALSWPSWAGGFPGSSWYFQYGIVDSGGPAGAALSNAVRATQP